MQTDHLVFFNKKIIDQNDNPLLIQALKQLKKVQIITVILQLLYLIPTIVFLYYSFEIFNIGQNLDILHFYIFTLFLIYIQSVLTSILPFLIYIRRSYIWKHPLLKNKMNLYIAFGMLSFGIALLPFFDKAIKILQVSNETYTYENEVADCYKNKQYVDWILLFVLIGIGSFLYYEIVNISDSLVNENITKYLDSSLFLFLVIPLCYYIFVLMLSMWGGNTSENWKWNSKIYTLGIWGMYLVPIIMFIIILKF